MLMFMDMDTYDQIEIPADFLEERAAFLQDGMKVTVESHEGKPIGVAIPDQVTLAVVEADPVVKGQTAASSYKPAMLENGVRILVPPFVGGRRARGGRHQRAHLRPPRRVGASASHVIPAKAGIQTSRSMLEQADPGCPACAGHDEDVRRTQHARLSPDERHGRRRPQGGPQPRARFRRGRAASGLAQRPGQFRHRRRHPRRGDPATRSCRAPGPATAS